MTLHIQLAPVISLGAGIAILVFPKLLNYTTRAKTKLGRSWTSQGQGRPTLSDKVYLAKTIPNHSDRLNIQRLIEQYRFAG